ncbi:casein kinase 2 regulatory subunit [Coemansia sp. RSA 988]|nr:casein kinase 2 regulatory subunit [Coemansia sp. RSA 988]
MAEPAGSSHAEPKTPDALSVDLHSSLYHSGLDNTESDFDEEPYASDDSANLTWISWFCSLKGHEYFCEVPEDFIEDDFNLTGLQYSINFYYEALDMILDIEDDNDDPLDANKIETIDSSAEVLYGLIHARYILTRNGLHMMADKYENADFGVCPRYCCDGALVVPCGRNDLPDYEPVKLFCPSCLDIYSPPSSRYQKIDGAYFGTTFPHMFFQAFPSLIPEQPPSLYTPKIYGFAINERSRTGPRMKWLRMHPLPDQVDEDEDTDAGSRAPGDSTDSQSPADTRHVDSAAAHAATTAASPLPQDSAAAPTCAPSENPREEAMDIGTDKAGASCPSTPAAISGVLPAEHTACKDEDITMAASGRQSALDQRADTPSENRRKDTHVAGDKA